MLGWQDSKYVLKIPVNVNQVIAMCRTRGERRFISFRCQKATDL